ncbi:hypothetical protein EDC19_0544 [Natranaerovirga hydrolytica]|uniref:Uncharacterized protein n=1 Tax=Natranaerovirga hydrolytica TaxID=680378 RepID=A0A4R1MY40_9FIRM|nr:hypothetical protein [Natranaerovirga hydrolytica]TCK98126.1 hypothetical protein EDC19_0544 [Natranaerovirga hydrolytica]
MKKRSLIFIGAILAIFIIVFVIALNNTKPGSFVYNTFKKSDSEWTLDEAKAKGQVKLDFRKGEAGEFKILPFKFEGGLDRGYEVYFKNEGPNEVKLNFREVEWSTETAKEDLQVESYFIAPGEELTTEFFNQTGDEDAKFWITISDPTEPRPMIQGEFYISQ